jgi:hypothetical protein
MSTKEIIQNIKKLPFKKDLIEKALETLYETKEERMGKAARELLEDYKKDKNHTAFAAIDLDKFYDTR